MKKIKEFFKALLEAIQEMKTHKANKYKDIL